jgi:hypothetical protein
MLAYSPRAGHRESSWKLTIVSIGSAKRWRVKCEPLASQSTVRGARLRATDFASLDDAKMAKSLDWAKISPLIVV